MSFADLKKVVRQLPPAQRRQLAILLARIADRENAGLAAELARRHARMDAGHKVTLEDLQRRHDELLAEGR
jgi:hypothetical protein